MSYRTVEHKPYPIKAIATITAMSSEGLDEKLMKAIKDGWIPYGNVTMPQPSWYVQQVVKYHASYDTGPR